METLTYRQAGPEDLPLIYDSWSSSYRNAHVAGPCPIHLWKPFMAACVEFFLSRPGVQAFVAFDPSAPKGAETFGWIAVEREVRLASRRRCSGGWETVMEVTDMPLVHYVYVKHAYRRNGIARGLLWASGVDPSKPFLYNCRTGIVSKLHEKIPQARWAPLIARYPKDTPTKEVPE